MQASPGDVQRKAWKQCCDLPLKVNAAEVCLDKRLLLSGLRNVLETVDRAES